MTLASEEFVVLKNEFIYIKIAMCDWWLPQWMTSLYLEFSRESCCVLNFNISKKKL